MRSKAPAFIRCIKSHTSNEKTASIHSNAPSNIINMPITGNQEKSATDNIATVGLNMLANENTNPTMTTKTPCISHNHQGMFRRPSLVKKLNNFIFCSHRLKVMRNPQPKVVVMETNELISLLAVTMFQTKRNQRLLT